MTIEKINRWLWPIALGLMTIQAILIGSALIGRGILRNSRTLDMWLHLLAIPLVVIALWVLIRAAWNFLAVTPVAMRDPSFLQNVTKIEQGKATFSDRRQNWMILLRHWQPSMIQLVLSFVLFGLTGFFANAVRILNL